VQVETEEDETTLEELRALTRVFVPQQVQDDFMEVSQAAVAVHLPQTTHAVRTTY
jgi:hypothetical protein